MLRHDTFDPTLLDDLHACEDQLPPGLRGEILAHGERALGPLRTLLHDDGFGAWHAVRLIAEIGGPAAIEPLLEALCHPDADSVVRDEAHFALAAMGPATVEPVLRLYEELSPDDHARTDCAGILAAAGVRDPRILAVLRAELDEDRLAIIPLLAQYGDPAALPDLARLLDAARIVDPSSPYAGVEIGLLEVAIEALGGKLTEEQRAKCAHARNVIRRRAELPKRRRTRPERPGRNDPCWCGSGRKYKRCHLREDAAAPV
jgi:hypothetical protein